MQTTVAHPSSVEIELVHSAAQVLSIDQRYGTRLHCLDLALIADGILVQRYYGYMTFAQRKFILEQVLLPAIVAQGAHKLLTDMSDMQGSWDNAEDWLAADFTPRILSTGMQDVAVVLSRDLRSQMSSIDFQERMQGRLHYMLFDTEEEALSWLRLRP